MEKERLKKDRKNMNMNMIPDDKPYFYKLIYDGLTNEHMRIPPMFVKHISEEVSDRVILKGPSGNQWHVKLSKKRSAMYLEDGWKQFMSDHSLGDNEFLLFGYNGNMSFNVQIFDKNGCERTVAYDTDSDQDFAFSEKNLKQGKPRKNPVETDHVKAQKYGSDTSNIFLRRQHSTQDDRNKNVEAAESFTSEFPHFKVCLKYSSVESGFMLPVPMAFAKANLPPSCTHTISIHNSQGKAWEVVCLYNGRRYCFSGGWRDLVRGNKLKKGDVCIFELIDRDKMQVNIFRSS